MAAGTGARPSQLPDLPILSALPAVREALTDQKRTVIAAPPGAGKTTVVPLALLDEPWRHQIDGGRDGRIVMLEPRRLAARAAAQRMATTTGSAVGDLIGYQTRDERRISEATRIEVLTEGVLTRRMQRDPELPGVAAVIFDEVHERNLQTDLGLALVLDVIDTIRPDLRLAVMSATADVERFAEFLDAPVVTSEGRMYDVDVRWRPSSSATASRRSGRAGARQRRAGARAGTDRGDDITRPTVAAVLEALSTDDGDVLVFLPGIGEIERVRRALESSLGPNIDVHRLAGALSLAEQDTALAASPVGRRRVVLSTDIAETSLTVDGIRVVVDAGRAREPRFDARTGMTRLTTVAASRASADQRAGRAGRTAPGAAYRLWSQVEHATRLRHATAEILQTDLTSFALEVAEWGSDELRLLDQPPAGALDAGRELLHDLDALDASGAVTELGRRMLTLPVHPRLARMIVGAPTITSCAVAALLDDRDIFRGRPDDVPADIELRLSVLAGDHRHDAADRGATERARRRAGELARRARIRGDINDMAGIVPEDAGRSLLAAYPDRLAGRRRRGQFQLRAGGGAWLPDDDPLAAEPFVVAADLDGRRDRARIRLAAAVDEATVIERFGDAIDVRRSISWDRDRDDVVETVERRLGAIRLATTVAAAPPGEETSTALLARVRDTDLGVVHWSAGAESLRARAAYLHRELGEPWPDWSRTQLRATLDDWLAPYTAGITDRRGLESLDLSTVLWSQLPWPEGAELDRLAPPTLELPTGRTVTIDYGGDGPEAAVRVQDVFGVTEHPQAGGQPIRLSLLSPADRPLQVTTDLPGFWRGSWADVRKEMAGRYPKHRWPEHPEREAPKRLKGDR